MFMLHRHALSRFRRGPLAGRFASVGVIGLLVMLLVVSPVMAQDGTPPPLAGEGDTSLPCFDGRLRIRDLDAIDDRIPAGLERVYDIGLAWEDDATLFSLRLGCPLLETGIQLDGMFFSRTAQAFYYTATNEIRATNADPDTVPILDTSHGVEVQFVYSTLIRAGFSEDSLLAAIGGVTIRPNTDAQPFGPPSAPRGDVYFHVSIEDRGEIVDLWVASRDGKIYQYRSE